jgi:archaellin
MAYYFKSLGYVTSDNYSALNYVEKARVDQAVSASIPSVKAKERDYVDFSAIPGAVLNFVAEMGDAVPMEQSICYLALSRTTVTSAKNFKASVESGMLLRQAFYRWLAKERVKETASAAMLIQMSVGEFYVSITNPNKYEISIDQLKLYFKTTAGTSTIDGARQSLGGIWIPAEETVELKVLAPTKSYDLVSWLAMAGTDTTTARSMAAEVWGKIQNGTITWTLEYDVDVSHGNDIQSYSYPA